MSYFNDIYKKPFLDSVKQWKLILYTTLVELGVVFFTFMLYLVAKKIIFRFLTPLGDNNLINLQVMEREVGTYIAELQNFFLVIIITVIAVIVIFFIIYTLSRTLIWNKIQNKKNNYLRNMAVDSILYIIGIVILTFCFKFIKPNYYPHYFGVFILSLLYYSFFCHLNLDKKRIKQVFSSAFSLDLLYLLPHFIILVIIIKILPAGIPSIIFLFILFNFFRIYAYKTKLNLNKE